MMKNKTIFTLIIAVIFIVAMIVYRESISLTELILSFTTSGSSIFYVWEWFNTKEIKKESQFKDKEISRLKMNIDVLKSKI